MTPARTPVTPAAGRGFRPARRAVVLAGAALVALAAITVAAFLVFFKPSPNVDKMTPDTTDVFLTVYLDPSLEQKMNVANLVHKFPGLKTDAEIHRRIDDLINQGSTRKLSFDRDIASWVGSRASALVQTRDNGHAVLLVDSRSDDRAKSSLADYRKSDAEGKSLSWTDDTYRGVTISVGTGTIQDSAQTRVYAYFDRTWVFGNSEALIKELVDTDQGKKPRLKDSAGYKAMVKILPSDNLVLLYVNGARVVGQIKDQIRSGQGSGVQVPEDQINQLDSFISLGFTITAKSDGLAGDFEITIDSSKLNDANRAALAASSGRNRLLDWIPQRAYGLFAATGLKASLQSAIDQALASNPDAKQGFDQMGLTGSGGALSHLTGDLALEISPGSTATPGGAFLLGTDSAGSLQNFLDKLGSALADSRSVPDLKVQTRNYKGIQITDLTAPSLTDQGYAPAYAVTGPGVGIVGSSPEQVQAAIDASQGGSALPAAARYKAALSRVDQNPGTVLYLDISEGARTVRGGLSGDQLNSYDRDVAPNLQPRAFILTGKNQPDGISEKLFLLIE